MKVWTTWYNLPFLISLGLGLVFAVLQIVGGFGDHDSDADIDSDGHDFFDGALDTLGVGKVPLMFILVSFLSLFGLIGLLLNAVAFQFDSVYPSWFFAVVLVLSLPLAFVGTSRTSRLFAKLAPENSLIVGFEQLVGRVGRVSSPTISVTYGRVEVRDLHGTVHTVFAQLATGEPLPTNTEVALVEYDQAKRCFIAKQFGR